MLSLKLKRLKHSCPRLLQARKYTSTNWFPTGSFAFVIHWEGSCFKLICHKLKVKPNCVTLSCLKRKRKWACAFSSRMVDGLVHISGITRTFEMGTKLVELVNHRVLISLFQLWRYCYRKWLDPLNTSSTFCIWYANLTSIQTIPRTCRKLV